METDTKSSGVEYECEYYHPNDSSMMDDNEQLLSAAPPKTIEVNGEEVRILHFKSHSNS